MERLRNACWQSKITDIQHSSMLAAVPGFLVPFVPSLLVPQLLAIHIPRCLEPNSTRHIHVIIPCNVDLASSPRSHFSPSFGSIFRRHAATASVNAVTRRHQPTPYLHPACQHLRCTSAVYIIISHSSAPLQPSAQPRH